MTKYQKAKDAAGRVVLGRPRPIVLYPGTSIEVLTPREGEVLEALAGGLSVCAIAAAQCVSQRSIDFHCCNLYAKLGAHSRQSAVHLGVRLGIIACPFCAD